jgi:GT2 family glycosyltransferase
MMELNQTFRQLSGVNGIWSKIGITSSKILYFYENNIIQYAGIPLATLLLQEEEATEVDVVNIMKSKKHSIHGAWWYEKSVLKEGLLYEGYFLYYEEYDFAERVRKAGYKIYYQPNSFYTKNLSLLVEIVL